MDETILEGVARCKSAHPVLDAALEIDGKKVCHERSRERFVLETDEGPVEIETGGDTILAPQRRLKDNWGDLADDPIAQAVIARAPGDHVKVVLEGAAVVDGERVCVRGEIQRREASDAYRGGTVGRVTHVRAIAIGIGDDARKAIEPKEVATPVARAPKPAPAPKVKRLTFELPIVLGLLGIAGVALSFEGALGAFGPRWMRPVALAIGISALTIALFAWRRRRFLPVFTTPSEPPRGTGLPWDIQPLVFACGFVVAGGIFFGLVYVWEGGASGGVMMAAAAVPFPFAAAAWLVITERKSARWLRRLILARTAGTKPGAWGARDATLRGASLSRTRVHDLKISSSEQIHTDKQGRTTMKTVRNRWYAWHEKGSATDGAIELDGASVPAQLGDALWGSNERTITLGDDPVYEEHAKDGDRVLVLGRLLQEGDQRVLRATGPESLVLYASGSSSPRAALLSRLAGHWAGVLLLLVVGVIGGWLAWRNAYQSHLGREGQVVSSTWDGVEAGDACTMRIGWHEDGAEQHCQVDLDCGFTSLYGGEWAEGFMTCAAREGRLFGSDPSPTDGDEAIQFDSTSATAWNESGDEVTVRFEPE